MHIHTVNSKESLSHLQGIRFLDLMQDDPFKRIILNSFGLTPVKSHFILTLLIKSFDYPWSHFKMTLERVRMQISFSEVSSYTDLEDLSVILTQHRSQNDH